MKWTDTYDIAIELAEKFPETDPLTINFVDLRSWIYTEPEALAKDINNKWAYDPKRPMMDVCVFHDSGEGEHFHIQVHPNTKRKI